MDLDKVDIQIIEQLEEDGRASLRKIAENIGVSPSTVSNRFSRLREEGVIEGFRPVIDYEKIGFELTAVVEVKVESHIREDVIPDLVKEHHVQSIYVTSGETDMILLCNFVDREDMYNFMIGLQDQKGVESTNTSVVLNAPQENEPLDLERLESVR